MTKQNGVDVWPNAVIWMRNELRSKVIVLLTMRAHGLIIMLFTVFTSTVRRIRKKLLSVRVHGQDCLNSGLNL